MLLTVVLEKTLESPLDIQKIKAVKHRGYQSWTFIGRTDAEVEAPILWPPDVNSWLFGKDPDAGKAWEPKDKEMTEDEMVGWHSRFHGHEFEQTQELVIDREAWSAAVHGVAKSQTGLNELNWRNLGGVPYHLKAQWALQPALLLSLLWVSLQNKPQSESKEGTGQGWLQDTFTSWYPFTFSSGPYSVFTGDIHYLCENQEFHPLWRNLALHQPGPHVGQTDLRSENKRERIQLSPRARAKDPKVKKVRLCRFSWSQRKSSWSSCHYQGRPRSQDRVQGVDWHALHRLRTKWPLLHKEIGSEESLTSH